LFAAATLLGCSLREDRDPASIATKYVEQRWPKSTIGPDGRTMPAVVEDQGANWHVYYRLPDGWIGGTPEVIIRKADLKVIDAYQSQ
jgi:hypothetical protein